MKKIFTLIAVVMMAVVSASASSPVIKITNVPDEYNGWQSILEAYAGYGKADVVEAQKVVNDLLCSTEVRHRDYENQRISEETWKAYYENLSTLSTFSTVTSGAASPDFPNAFSAGQNVDFVVFFFEKGYACGSKYAAFIYSVTIGTDGNASVDMSGKSPILTGALMSDGSESIAQVEADAVAKIKSSKMIKDGKIVIKNDGKEYSVAGQLLK